MLGRIRARHAWALCVLALTATGSLVAILGSAGGAAGAQKQQLVADSAALGATSPIIKPPNSSCSVITGLTDLAANPQYPAAIMSSTDTPAGNGNPRYCDVQGMIAPQTHFDLKLPESTWQGRYLQNGCGGYCGSVNPQSFPSCDTTLGGDFAMATDDEGHTTAGGLGGAGLFSFNDQKLRNEYGYESEQALYVVAREIIKDYYGVEPNYSYYDGCSDGGREAMEMAERYPDDFNGIIAGAPEIYAGPLNAEMQTWAYKVNQDAHGNAILTAAEAPLLAAKVVSTCGGDDGVADGIITDPQDCHFNPAVLECPSGTVQDPTKPTCLTAAQVQVADELYQGPVDQYGRKLYPGGLPYGSEGGWNVFALPPAPSSPTSPVPATESLDYFGLSLPYLRYQLLPPGQLGPDPSQWQFTDHDFFKMFPTANTWDALDTNLTAFRRHGGKLLIWQGWADNGIPPFGTVDYYLTLAQRNHGIALTAGFARLFMFPTVYHCGGGYTNSSFDVVLPMVQWVEQGTAPTEIDAADNIGTQANPNNVTRPVYPYPDVPVYNGNGAPTNVASSFHAEVAKPHQEGKDYTDWLGNYLLYQPIDGGREQGDSRRG